MHTAPARHPNPKPGPGPGPKATANPNLMTAAAIVLWAVTLAALGLCVLLVLLVALWASAAGETGAAAGLLLRVALAITAGGAVVTGLYHAPGVRRLSRPTRFALSGALACPAPTACAVWVFVLA